MKAMKAKAAMKAMKAKAAAEPAKGAPMKAMKAKAVMKAMKAKAAAEPAKGAAMKAMKAKAAMKAMKAKAAAEPVIIELLERLLPSHLGIVDMQLRALLQKFCTDIHRRGFPRVSGVLLEGKAENRDLLSPHCIEHREDDLTGEVLLRQIVHLDDMFPVLGDVMKPEGLAEVDKIENVLLKASPAEADRGVQKLWPDAGIRADCTGNFAHIC